MNIKYLRIYFIIFSFFTLASCIDPYDVNFGQKNNILVVEGFLTDDYLNPDTIKIQYSIYTQGNTSINTISSVKASIWAVNSGKETNLIDHPNQDAKIVETAGWHAFHVRTPKVHDEAPIRLQLLAHQPSEVHEPVDVLVLL